MKQPTDANKSKLRLTKSPKIFIYAVFGFSSIVLSLAFFLVLISTDIVVLKLLTVILALTILLFTASSLRSLSEAYFLSDMIIVEPFFGKKIIIPYQGAIVKKSFFLSFLQICKIHIRLDGKKYIYLLHGKYDEIISEKSKIEEILKGIQKNKKVNRKPGSVSSGD